MNTFQDGLNLYREGRFNEAVEILHIAATAEQNNHKAWNALGVALSKTGDLSQAIICFENALSLNPGNQTYRKNLERARLKEKRAEIIPVLTMKQVVSDPVLVTDQTTLQSADLNPDEQSSITSEEPSILKEHSNAVSENAQTLLNQALSLYSQGTYHDMPELILDSLSYVDQSLILNSEYYDAWQLKVSILTALGQENPQYQNQALEACNQALKLKPENPSMHFNKALLLESLGQYEDAISAYDLSYQYSTEEPMRLGMILMKKGAALEHLGKESLAIQTYGLIPVTDRFFPDALEKIAEFKEKQGMIDEAVVSYRSAGLSFIKSGAYEKAIVSFTKLLSLQPDDEEGLYHKGVASFALYEINHSQEMLEDALRSFDAVLKIQPENITYLIQKGRALLDLGRYEEGLQALDRALWLNPSDGITLMNKGIALYQLSRREEAQKYFELVCTHYPEYAAPWIMRARIHLDWKDYETALTEIETALEKSPEDPKAWEHKAIILRAMGRTDEANLAESNAQ